MEIWDLSMYLLNTVKYMIVNKDNNINAYPTSSETRRRDSKLKLVRPKTSTVNGLILTIQLEIGEDWSDVSSPTANMAKFGFV